jgi:DNA-binding transcriptional regulator LsrR (DeoR family)
LVFIESKITHDVIGIGRQFVGKIPDGIIVAEGNQKIDVLKNNSYLNNEFDDLKH